MRTNIEVLKTIQRVTVRLLKDVAVFWRAMVVVAAPVLLLIIPICFNYSKASLAAYVVSLMAVYWTTEAIPLPVTSLLPLLLYPTLGVVDIDTVCQKYFVKTTWLFFGGISVALAIEESRLHERFALCVLLIVGTRPKWLMLGFIVSTGFLSMWMSNTACTAMMLPIAVAVVDEVVLDRQNSDNKTTKVDHRNVVDSNSVELVSCESKIVGKQLACTEYVTDLPAFDALPHCERRLYKGVLLSICYSANIGGIGTLIGTATNLTFQNHLQKTYKSPTPITFGTWMMMAVPLMIVLLAVNWLWLQLLFFGWRSIFECKRTAAEDKGVRQVLKEKLQSLGSMSFAEKSVLFWFLVLAALLISSEEGLKSHFKPKHMDDSILAVAVAFILILWPKQLPDFLCLRKDKLYDPKLRDSILPWSALQRKFPWGLLFLLGGGFAMAHGVQSSGLSTVVAHQLVALATHINATALMIVCFISIVLLTEVTSNVATTQLFLPFISHVADSLKVNPLYFLTPITLGASFAFMLPVATAPNSIVFGSGRLKVMDMVLAGCGMNVLCVIITIAHVHTYPYYILFNSGAFPEWAKNSTIL